MEKRHVTITIMVSVNGSPWTPPIEVVVRDGDVLRIVQPVTLQFSPGELEVVDMPTPRIRTESRRRTTGSGDIAEVVA